MYRTNELCAHALHVVQASRLSAVSTPVCPGSASATSRSRPSPERLEAHMRGLAYSQDSVVKTLIDELKEQRRANQQLQVRATH